MDKIDLDIIKLLKNNGRMTSSDISKRVQLSIPAVSERIRKLEEAKIINQYTILVNRPKLNLNLMAFILVNVDSQHVPKFKQKILQCDSILECHHLAGECDYLLKVVVENTAALENFVTNTLKKEIPVAKTNTIVVLSTLKEQI